MTKRKLVVIGGDAAGMSAASKVRREHPDREIVVFERGIHTSYSACGIPYYIGGIVASEESLIVRKPETFIEKQNMDVRIRHEVTEIDTKNKKVRVTNIGRNEEFRETYDELLIATGALPVKPELPGIDANGIFALSILQSGIDVFEYIEKNKPAKAVIIGGGYIGIEMAEALLHRKMQVSLLDLSPQVMNTLDKDMADMIEEYMENEGVKLFLNEKLQAFEKDSSGQVKGVITDKQSLPADLVILGMGIKPNTGIAGKAGIQLGVKDAIHVNRMQQTSEPDVWATGDCAESFHLITRQQAHIALGTVASKQGLVAGINISGGKTEFPGVVGTAITKFEQLEISRTGLSEKEAREFGFEYEAKVIHASNFAGYYPGSEKISVKLVAEKSSGRLLGGQIVGNAGSAKRIDTLATAISAGMTAKQFIHLDLAYAPPFSNVWDPLQIAARVLI